MKSRCRLHLLAILSLSCLLTGCTTMQNDGDFDVTLVNVRSVNDSAGEVQLAFTLRLQNASPSPVTMDGAAHKIYLNGIYIGQGLTNERVDVPRLATTTQVVTVNLSTFRLARALYGVYRTQKADYRVESTLYAAEGGHPRRLHAQKEGAVDLKELARPAGR